MNDVQDIKELLVSSKEKIELQLNFLNILYQKNKIKTAIIFLNSLIAIEKPKLWDSLLTVGLISTALNSSIGLGVAGIGVIGKWALSIYERNNKIKSNEMNYLFQAKKAGIFR